MPTLETGPELTALSSRCRCDRWCIQRQCQPDKTAQIADCWPQLNPATSQTHDVRLPARHMIHVFLCCRTDIRIIVCMSFDANYIYTLGSCKQTDHKENHLQVSVVPIPWICVQREHALTIVWSSRLLWALAATCVHSATANCLENVPVLNKTHDLIWTVDVLHFLIEKT